MSKISEGSKVCIIGAGAVGATIAFAISMKQLCSELVLIDVNQDKALGEALDISHGLPFLGQMTFTAVTTMRLRMLTLSSSQQVSPESPARQESILLRRTLSSLTLSQTAS